MQHSPRMMLAALPATQPGAPWLLSSPPRPQTRRAARSCRASPRGDLPSRRRRSVQSRTAPPALRGGEAGQKRRTASGSNAPGRSPRSQRPAGP
eukprot:2848952-Prymnesium_polylepis.3